MAEGFDPYEAWLGISKSQRPINVYLLLGLPLGESDGAKINEAGVARLRLLESHRRGPHAAQAEKLIEMVGEGLKVVLDPKKKAKYDEKLRGKEAPAAATPVAAPGGAIPVAQAVPVAPAIPVAQPLAAPPPVQGPPPVVQTAAVPQARPIATAVPPSAAPPVARAAAVPPAAIPVGAVPAAMPVGAIPQARPLSAPPPVVDGAAPLFVDRPPVGKAVPAAAVPVAPAAKSFDPRDEKERKKKQGMMLLLGLVGALVLVIITALIIVSMPPSKEDPKGKLAKNSAVEDETVEVESTASLAALQGGADRTAPGADAAARDAVEMQSPNAKRAVSAEKTVAPEAAAAHAAPEAAPIAASEPDTVPWQAAPDENPSPPLPVSAGAASLLKPDFAAKLFAIDPKLSTAVMASPEGQVAVFDLGKREKKGAFAIPGEKLLALAMLDENRVLTWSEPGGLQTWSSTDGASLGRWAVPTAGGSPDAGIAVSPTGALVALVRNGIRFYNSTTGNLQGIVPYPEGATATAIGFDPEGQRLRAVMQFAAEHRIVDVDLTTGAYVSEGTKPCPGALDGTGYRGPLYTRTGTGGKFIFCGRYVLKGDDGYPALRIEKPPAILYPLVGGALWTSDGGPIENSRLDWDKIVKSVQKFDSPRGRAQIGPGVGMSLVLVPEGLSPERAALVQQHLDETLGKRFEKIGMNVGGSASTVCKVKYKEEVGGKIANLRYRTADGKFVQKPAELDGVKTKMEIVITNSDVGEKGEPMFKFSMEMPAMSNRMAAPVEAADKPAEEAYLAARLDWLSEQIVGLDMPYYLSKDILGLTRLPIVIPRVDPSLTSDEPSAEKPAAPPSDQAK